MSEQTSEEKVAGGEFEVRLDATPTTGYRWQLASMPDGVAHLGTDVDAQSSAAPGDPAQQVFRFRAECPRSRSWDTRSFDQPFHDHDVTPHAVELRVFLVQADFAESDGAQQRAAGLVLDEHARKNLPEARPARRVDELVHRYRAGS